MDPLQDIPLSFLFCYSQSDHSYYGFHILSLLNYFHKSRLSQFTNPFNREIISLSSIFKWFRLTRIYFPETFQLFQEEPCYRYFINKKGASLFSVQSSTRSSTIRNIPTTTPPSPYVFLDLDVPVQYNNVEILDEEHVLLNEHLIRIQSLPINTRIQELFMDFDLCGNYTDAQWFLQLNIRYLKFFYMRLKERWRNLPLSIQQSICLLGNPFYLVHIHHFQISFQELKWACVRIMELITYGTYNQEDQKLGIYQILISLTYVSENANRSLHHLINL